MNRLRALLHTIAARLGLELDWAALGEDPASQWCGAEWTLATTETRIDGYVIARVVTGRSDVHACALEPGHDGPCLCDCGENTLLPTDGRIIEPVKFGAHHAALLDHTFTTIGDQT